MDRIDANELGTVLEDSFSSDNWMFDDDDGESFVDQSPSYLGTSSVDNHRRVRDDGNDDEILNALKRKKEANVSIIFFDQKVLRGMICVGSGRGILICFLAIPLAR